jgi:hypothetical protein
MKVLEKLNVILKKESIFYAYPEGMSQRDSFGGFP